MAKEEKAHINIPKGPEAGNNIPVHPQNPYYGGAQSYVNPNPVNNGQYNPAQYSRNGMQGYQNGAFQSGVQDGRFPGQYPQNRYQSGQAQNSFQSRSTNQNFYTQNNASVQGNYPSQNNASVPNSYPVQNSTNRNSNYSVGNNSNIDSGYPAHNNVVQQSNYPSQNNAGAHGAHAGSFSSSPARGQNTSQATYPSASQNIQNSNNSGFDRLTSNNGYAPYTSYNPNDSFSPTPAHSSTNANQNGAYGQNRQTQQNGQSQFSDTSQYSQPYAKHSNSDEKISLSSSKKKHKPKSRSSAIAPIITCIVAIAAMFGLAFLLREHVFQAYEIPSGSMEETIMTGDMVFAEKISHFISPPQRGDIITFEDPEVEGRVLIKRCIAVGGQTVDIKNNKFIVDGVEIDEPYTNGKPTKTLNRSKITFPYTIPQGEIWVMGDNRTNSQDSRYYGSIPVSSVIGRALLVYWPTSDAKVL